MFPMKGEKSSVERSIPAIVGLNHPTLSFFFLSSVATPTFLPGLEKVLIVAWPLLSGNLEASLHPQDPSTPHHKPN